MHMHRLSGYTRVLQVLGIATITAALSACGGGGGSSGSALSAGSSGGSATAPPPNLPDPVPYAEAEQIFPFITAVTIPDDGQPLVDFQLTDENSVAILDLDAGDIRFTIAKLQGSPIGSQTGSWQSYVNQVEHPEVGDGIESKLQATAERGTSGTLTNNGDGTYHYRFALNITAIDDDEVLAQAETEGLDLSYEPGQTHRVAMQFSNSKQPANPIYDWVPATGAVEQIFHQSIVATPNCNGCHEQLALHGDDRIEMAYCVTCHNPGSTDADSGNSVDFKVMVHKIHAGRNLPTVVDGGEYVIYGHNNSKHDYSNVAYPNDLLSCQVCHGGNLSGDEQTAQLTSQGDNWTEYVTAAACGSCHDDLDFSEHFGGQPDDSNCSSCHQTTGVAGSIMSRHRNLATAAGKRFAGRIHAISNTMRGEFPVIQYSVVDPDNGDTPYDLHNDPAWTQGGGASRLEIDLAWSTTDYENTGNESDNANAVGIDALSGTPVGDGSYTVTSPVAIPDGSLEPGIRATGSGAAAMEGHPGVEIDGAVERVAFPGVVEFFSIDEGDGAPRGRREAADLDKCLACHGQLSLHGSNRTDNLQLCVTCHNPRNTDRRRRESADPGASDGKLEESVDMKTMIHGIHAAAMRLNALQIVGFGGSVHVYDDEHVHYPGRLGNCASCHKDDSHTLPLASTVLGTTIDTGSDQHSPLDDLVITPTAAVCSSCHDGGSAAAHMEQNGGSFSTTQAEIDNGNVVEDCATCHGPGRTYDADLFHPVREP